LPQEAFVIRKFITLMMVITIFTVQAHASTHNGLKAAFDEMNYALTVDWDQTDRTFYESQLKKFTGTVRELQKQGLTNEQMIDFAKSQVKDARVAGDLDTAFSMITINRMSSEEASRYIVDSMKRAYSNGASWNGDVLVYLAVGLLIVALAVGIAAAAGGSGGSNVGTPTTNTPGYNACYNDCYYYSYSCGYDYYSYPLYCQAYTCDYVCY
jgi:hypothetical protein